MTTLHIKDLAIAEDLSQQDMAAVQGGTGKGPAYYCGPYDVPYGKISTSDYSFNADQMLKQCQDTQVNNGNNVAYSCGITANVNPCQDGSNNIKLGGHY